MDLITTATSRRALLGAAGATGVALAAGTTVAAAATSDAKLPTIEVGNYSFPDLPKKPTSADLLILTFLDSMMLAAEELYDQANVTGELSAPVLAAFRNNHRTQAEMFKALAGTEATKIPNRAIMAEYAEQVAGPSAVRALGEITDRIIATLIDQLGVVEGTNVSEMIAGSISSCARQRLVIGGLIGEEQAISLPAFESTQNAFTMDAYPAERV